MFPRALRTEAPSGERPAPAGGRPARRGRRGGRGRRILLAAGIGLALFVAVLFSAAWILSPDPTDPAGVVRADLRAAGSVVVPLSEVSPRLREAVVATEDERFYRHHGIDAIGLLRAAAFDVSHASLSQGASTITEQLAKVLYLGGDDHSPWRKVEDMVLAVRLEESLSKDEILQLYLNSVSFGPRATGVGAASERYFGIPPSRLDLAQATLLAGLIQAPSADDPFVDGAAARARQAEVLTAMIKQHYVTAAEAKATLASPLPMASGPALPAEPNLTLAVAPQWSVPKAAAGVALLMAASGLTAVTRRRPRLALRLGAVASCAGGLLLVARAFRAD